MSDSVQVAHEALIREWPTLRGWLEDNREGLRLHRQLTEAAQEWNSMDRQLDLLYRGIRLAQTREWSVLHDDDVNTLEKEFLEASRVLSETEAVEREAQQRRELEAAQKLAENEKQRADEGVISAQRLRRRSTMVSGVGALALLLALLAIFAWRSSAAQAAVNQSMVLASAAQQANQTGQGDLALALALEGVKINQPPLESLKVLRSVALGGGTRLVFESQIQEVKSLAISPDAKTAILGSCASLNLENLCLAGELSSWEVTSGKELRRWSAHSGWITAVVFSSDGQILISGAQDGSLILWGLDGKTIRPLVGHKGSITGLVAVPATNNILSGSVDGYLILWDLSTGHVLQRFSATSTPVTAIALSADGLTAVSAHQDGSIRVWDLDKRNPTYYFPRSGDDIGAVAINPDGRWILYTDNTVSNTTLNRINTLDGSLLDQQKFDCTLGQMVLSGDGSYVFLTCSTTIIQIDTQSWNIYRNYSGHGEVMNKLVISPDGYSGVSASREGNIRIWNLSDQLNFQIITIDSDILNSLAISTDGKYLILNDYYKDGFEEPAMWDINQQKVVRVYFQDRILSIKPGGVKISPDNRYIAALAI